MIVCFVLDTTRARVHAKKSFSSSRPVRRFTFSPSPSRQSSRTCPQSPSNSPYHTVPRQQFLVYSHSTDIARHHSTNSTSIAFPVVFDTRAPPSCTTHPANVPASSAHLASCKSYTRARSRRTHARRQLSTRAAPARARSPAASAMYSTTVMMPRQHLDSERSAARIARARRGAEARARADGARQCARATPRARGRPGASSRGGDASHSDGAEGLSAKPQPSRETRVRRRRAMPDDVAAGE